MNRRFTCGKQSCPTLGRASGELYGAVKVRITRRCWNPTLRSTMHENTAATGVGATLRDTRKLQGVHFCGHVRAV